MTWFSRPPTRRSIQPKASFSEVPQMPQGKSFVITPVGSGKRSRSAKRFTGPRHPLAYAIATVLAFAAWPALAGNTTAPALSQGWLNQAQTQAGTQSNG